VATIPKWRRLVAAGDVADATASGRRERVGMHSDLHRLLQQAPAKEQFELVRRRKFPLVGDGGGVWSFIHVADAAEATLTAVEHGTRGVYNVVDDDPAPVAEWLPALAQTLSAKKPMRVPRFVGRLFAGEAGVVMMTEVRGASNAKAKRELGWRPAHPSWRQGFAAA
jgi:nucleoside-diphosphate-sugar epimerase